MTRHRFGFLSACYRRTACFVTDFEKESGDKSPHSKKSTGCQAGHRHGSIVGLSCEMMCQTMTTLGRTTRCLSILMGVALLTVPMAAADEAAVTGKPTNQASKRNQGSAAVLTGRVVLANVYVSDLRSRWTRQARLEVRRRMAAAIDFISDQAARYDRRVTAIETNLSATYASEAPSDLTADPAWTQKVITAAGKRAPADFAHQLKVENQADHVLFVLHVNKPGNSHNLVFSAGIDRDYWAERVVCFSRLDNQWPTPAATYAHEIMHGFGAGELYFPFDETNARERLASRIFEDDVMFRVDYQLERLEIGAYTAYRVGWRDELEQQYRVFEDPK